MNSKNSKKPLNLLVNRLETLEVGAVITETIDLTDLAGLWILGEQHKY